MRIGLACAGVLAMLAVPASAEAPVGKAAPPFSLKTFAGDTVTRDMLRGQVVVLNYWATWCGPCKAELPAMDAYYRRHKDRGLAMFAITTEDSLPKFHLRKLSAVMAIPLSNRMRGSGYGVIGHAVPTSYIIDRAGIVRYAKSGAFDEASLAATLEPLLAEPVPASSS